MAPVDDLDRIMAVMTAAFDPLYGEAWTRRQVESALILGGCRYRLIGEDGEAPGEGTAAAGFALLRATLDEEELLLFAIHPEFRRRGLGARLLGGVLATAQSAGIRRILLEMRRGNSAENLYRAAGFQPVGLRRNYYRTSKGERLDAITFALDLD
ncbi:MAG: GNAT family N-acetyltransferase [Sphingomonadales bacterium]|nr:GNAT family N-acetyltransferase [Sphingomonadales bacterium]